MKYDLEFQPAQRRRRDFLLRFFMGFGAILLLLAVASLVALQHDDFLDNLLSAYIRPTETTTEAPEDDWPYTGEAVFLLSCSDSAGKELRFAALLRVNAQQKAFTVVPLSPRAKTPYGQELTLEQALKEGGVKALQAAVEALTETKIDRYIAGTDDQFIEAVNDMGNITVQLSEQIRYRSAAFGLTLAAGSQRLQGDMLLRYFRYLDTLDETPPLQQGELIKRMLESYLVTKNGDTPERLEVQFNLLVGVLQTNISVTDLYAQRELLLALLAEPEQIIIEVKE